MPNQGNFGRIARGAYTIAYEVKTILDTMEVMAFAG